VQHTFHSPLTVGTPCNNLIPNLSLAVDDQHGYPSVWEVRDAFITDNGDKLAAWITGGKVADVLKGTFTTGYAE
jgi:hypothetical protein